MWSRPELCVSTDQTTGAYSIRLIEAPYTIQVSASRHVTVTQSINITRNVTTTANIELDSAHVLYAPAPVVEALPSNTVATSTLLLDNQGAGTLQYRLREATGRSRSAATLSRPPLPGPT